MKPSDGDEEAVEEGGASREGGEEEVRRRLVKKKERKKSEELRIWVEAGAPRVVEATGGDGPGLASHAAYQAGIHGGCPVLP